MAAALLIASYEGSTSSRAGWRTKRFRSYGRRHRAGVVGRILIAVPVLMILPTTGARVGDAARSAMAWPGLYEPGARWPHDPVAEVRCAEEAGAGSSGLHTPRTRCRRPVAAAPCAPDARRHPERVSVLFVVVTAARVRWCSQ